jgi:ribosomal-protein-alanine N-acetyltransferase
MSVTDLPRVLEIADSLQDAPHWQLDSYLEAIGALGSPLRIALTAADATSERPLGFLIASVVAPDAELESIAVAADAQRMGIGNSLLQALFQKLADHDVTRLLLEVRASNRGAIRFYEMCGFRGIGRRNRYYADPQEDAVLLGKDLRRIEDVATKPSAPNSM